VLPPLREHPEDLAALAEHLAHRTAVRFGFALQLPSPQDITLLTNYAWPGNVRELASVIDRAAILGAGKSLEIAKALGVMTHGRLIPQTTGRVPAAPLPGAATPIPLEAALKQHIEAALAMTGGRVEGPYGAARLLDINPHTLRGKMRKLEIAWRKFRPGRTT
jgi:DNA-binding NtrC family response regulator